MSDIDTAVSKSKSTARPSSRLYWWTREIAGFAVWALFFVKAFVFDYDVYLVNTHAPDLAYLLKYRFVGMLFVAACIITAIGRSRFRKIFLYIALYPAVLLLWTTPLILLANWPITLAFAPAIKSFIISARQTVLWVSLFVFSAFTILAFDNRYALITAMSALAIILAGHFWNAFYRAFATSSVFLDIAGRIRVVRKWVESQHLAGEFDRLSKLDNSSPGHEEQWHLHLLSLYAWTAALQIVARRIQRGFQVVSSTFTLSVLSFTQSP